MKRKSDSDSTSAKAAKSMSADAREQLRAELIAASRSSKSSLARTLMSLRQQGLLNDDELGDSREHRRLTTANERHATAGTPYGQVVQSLDFGIEGIPRWEYVHPIAFLYYLSSMSTVFGDMLGRMIDESGTQPLRMLLYGDEMTPGNPLRSDKGRELFNWYYAFLEMPPWLLQRKDGWFLFGSIRSTLLAKLPGGVSEMVKRLLKVVLIDGIANSTQGFFVVVQNRKRLLRASFSGFLADEKGLKEILDIKGASGTKPCIACKNVVNFIHKTKGPAKDYIVGLDCTDRALLDAHTDSSVWKMVDRLSMDSTRLTSGQFKDLQKHLGVNYNQRGLLFCPELRPFIKPVEHYIRDWQHTLVSSGVATLEIASMVKALQTKGVSLGQVSGFSLKFSTPKERPPVNPNWFNPHFIDLKKLTVKHFSNDVLGMVPILAAFLRTCVLPLGILQENIKCFDLLEDMMTLLLTATHMTDVILARMQSLVDEHATLMAALYPAAVKIKFHHLIHLPQDLHRLRLSLSCFVTERKHKDLKQCVLHVFRHVEHTTTFNFVNYYAQEVLSGRFSFLEQSLIGPRELPTTCNVSITVAQSASTAIGRLCRDDVVVVREGASTTVGKIVFFFKEDDCDDILTHVECYTKVGSSNFDWDITTPRVAIIDVRDVIGALMWMQRKPTVIYVAYPKCHARMVDAK
jgi:hypothetical protein